MPVDQDLQELYDEGNRRGLFRTDPDLQALGHEARLRGLVADPTQGGLVNSNPPQAAPQPVPVSAAPTQPFPEPAAYMQPGRHAPTAPLVPPPAAPPTAAPHPRNFLTEVKPSGTSRLKPIGFIKSPLETSIKSQNAALDQISRQFGPGHHYAEGGPVDVKKRAAADTTAQLHAALPDLWSDWVKRARRHRQDEDRVTKEYRLWQQGKLSGAQAAQLRQDWHDLEMNRRGLIERRQRLWDYDNNFAKSSRASLGDVPVDEEWIGQMRALRADEAGIASLQEARKAGMLTPHRAEQLAGQEKQLATRRRELEARAPERTGPFHYGPYLPSEVQNRDRSSHADELASLYVDPSNWGLLGRPIRWAAKNGLNPVGTQTEALARLPEARRRVMLEGHYPPLPENPGKTPQERAEYDRQTLSLRRNFFENWPGFGLHPHPITHEAMQQVKAHLTPWQKKLFPIFQQQFHGEQEAIQRSGADIGLLKDAGMFLLGEGAGKLVGGAASRLGARFLLPLEERLAQSGARPFVQAAAKFGMRTAPRLAGGAGGAALAGGAGSAAMLGLEDLQNQSQGGRPMTARDYLAAAQQGARQTAPIGAAFAAGHALLHPRVTALAPGYEAYGQKAPGHGKELPPDLIDLPDGAQVDLNRSTRADLERVSNYLPADHPAKAKIDAKLWGQTPPVNAARVAHANGEVVSARSLSEAEVGQVLQDYTSLEQPGQPGRPVTDADLQPGQRVTSDRTGSILEVVGPHPEGVVELRMVQPGEGVVTPVGESTRYTPEGMRQDMRVVEGQGLSPEQQQNKAAAEALAQHHEAYREQQADAMPDVASEGQQQAAWSKQRVLGQGHYNVVKGLADRLREQFPELAAKLDEATGAMRGDQRRDFIQDYQVASGAYDQRTDTIAPPEQSTWRRLTDAERAMLPENVRRILMLQDIRNSGMVLQPGMASSEFGKGMEKWSTAKIEKTANDLLVEAETKFGEGKPPVAEARSQPAPAPVAAPTGAEVPPATASSETSPADTTGARMPTIEAATVREGLATTPRPVEGPTPSIPKQGLHRENSIPAEPANVSTETHAEQAVRAVADRGEASVFDLSQKLGLDVEEAKRLVQSLQKDGILGPETDQGTYRLAMERAKAEAWVRARPDAYQARAEVAETRLQAKAQGEMGREVAHREEGRENRGRSNAAQRRAAKAEAEQSRRAEVEARRAAQPTTETAKPAEVKPVEAKPTEAKPTEAKPPETKPTEAKPTETAPPTLPKKIKQPVKVYVDGQRRAVRFASDLDHALFVVGGGKSPHDGDLMAFLRGHLPQATDAQIRQIGEKVRDSVRQAAKGGAGSLDLPALYRDAAQTGKKGGSVEAGRNWQDEKNPKIAPPGTPGGDMSDFQAFGTNFPAPDENSFPLEGRKGGSAGSPAAPEKPPGTPQEEAPAFADKIAAHPHNVEAFVNARGDDTHVADTLKTILGRELTTPLPQRYQNIRHWIKGMTDGFNQVFEGLDRNVQNAEFEMRLLRRMDAETIAHAYAHRSIDQALRRLSKNERFIVDWQRYLNDMVASIDEQRETWKKDGYKLSDFKPLLPTGWTEETARANQAKTEAFLKSADAKADGLSAAKIADAHTKIVAYRDPIVKRFTDVYEQVHGVKLKLNADTYFRHNMLYLNAAEAPLSGSGGGKGVRDNPRASYLKRRLGSDMAYNTNFVEAELTWLPDMIKQTMDLEILAHVDERFNIDRQVKLSQAELKDNGMIDYLTQHRDGAAITTDKLPALAKLAAEGRLPDKFNGQFKVLRDALRSIAEHNRAARVNGKNPMPLSPEMQAHLKEYAGWLLEADGKGGVKVRNLVDDPRWLARSGYKAFQAQEGRHFFRAMTLPERVIRDAAGATLGQVLVDAGELRQVLAVGAQRKTMYLPAHIADLLNGYTGSRGDTYQSRLQQSWGKVLGVWKWDKLYNPAHSGIYWLHNAASDLQAIVRGNPRALLYVKRAGGEVFRALRGKAVSAELGHWIGKGGLGSTFVAREGLGRGAGVDVLQKYYTHPSPTWQKLLHGFYNVMELPHEWREATGRYAAYLAYLDQIKENGGSVKNYGASMPDLVDGLTDFRDKAYKLSNDLIGAYNEVSPNGQWLRKNVFPFWSWKEVNVKREWNLFRNALYAPDRAARAGQRLVGGAPLGFAMALGRYAMGAAGVGAMAEAWNRIHYGADYRKHLSKEMRDRLEPVWIINQDPATGQMTYVDAPSNFRDVTDLLNINDGMGYYRDYADRKMTLTEIAKDMLIKGGVGTVATQAGPQYKLLLEGVAGYTLFPDVTDPRHVNRMEALLREVSLDKTYKKYFGIPLPPPTKVGGVGGHAPWTLFPLGIGGQDMWHLLAFNSTNLHENNYFDVKTDAAEWLRRKKGGGGASPAGDRDPKATAAYYFRLSLRYGDLQSAEKFLWQYGNAGGTDKAMQQSMADLEPLHGLKLGDQARYIESLNAEDTERLRRAYLHWANLVAPKEDMAWFGGQKLDFATINEFKKQVDGALKQEWSERLDAGMSLEPVLAKIQGMAPGDRARYLASRPASEGETIRAKYRELAERAAPGKEIDAPDSLPLPAWVEKMQNAIANAREAVAEQQKEDDAYRGQ